MKTDKCNAQVKLFLNYLYIFVSVVNAPLFDVIIKRKIWQTKDKKIKVVVRPSIATIYALTR